jgi:hypothetical protein
MDDEPKTDEVVVERAGFEAVGASLDADLA